MELFLVQHGLAKPEDEDPERSLTEEGAEAVWRMAAWATRIRLSVDQIRHSGKRRAEQTAEIFAERVGPVNGVVAIPGLQPNDDVHLMAEALQAEEGSLMLVGHLPFLSHLVSLLLAGNPQKQVVQFQNAGIVSLSRREGDWSINWAVTPDLVDSAG